MEGEDRKSPRSLRDISYLFLSSEERKTTPSPSPASASWIACLDPENECSLEINLMLASKVETRMSKVVLLDFHFSQEKLDHTYARFTRSIAFRALDPTSDWLEILRSEETNLFLLDLPWNCPLVLESVIGALDGLVLVMKPSLTSVKGAFRLLKSIKHLFHKDVYVKWNGISSNLGLLTSQWSALIRHFLQQEVTPIEDFQRVVEKVRSSQSDRSFESRLLLPDSLDSPAIPNAFFERGRLSRQEIEAFSSLACCL